MNIHSIITVNRAILAPWCNRRVGPGVYEVPGDARRFFRTVTENKMLAHGHCSLKLVDLDALAVEETPVAAPVVVPVPETPVVTSQVVEEVAETVVAEEPKIEEPVTEPSKKAGRRSKREETPVVDGPKDETPSAE